MRQSDSPLESARIFHHRAVIATAVAFVGLSTLAIVWLGSGPGKVPSSGSRRIPFVAEKTNPVESFETVREVIASGGVPLAREAAVAWLDRQARERLVLETEAETMLLDTLRQGGHPAWTSGYSQHLFNSACNALRIRPSDGGAALTRILQSHAASHPDRVLRLYSLQHIDSMRKSGHLPDALVAETRAMLHSLAIAPDNDVAGTALKILGEWDGPSSATSSATVELAAQIATDRSRPVDVRVCAIHSAGPASLDPSRIIASDASEPIQLRKAAIARIGRHGDQSDLPSLRSLRGESARLAQAADPALQSLTRRLDSPRDSAPMPYPSLPTTTTP